MQQRVVAHDRPYSCGRNGGEEVHGLIVGPRRTTEFSRRPWGTNLHNVEDWRVFNKNDDGY